MKKTYQIASGRVVQRMWRWAEENNPVVQLMLPMVEILTLAMQARNPWPCEWRELAAPEHESGELAAVTERRLLMTASAEAITSPVPR